MGTISRCQNSGAIVYDNPDAVEAALMRQQAILDRVRDQATITDLNTRLNTLETLLLQLTGEPNANHNAT